MGIMQSAYDAMDVLDVPVPDGIDELRCAVAAMGNAGLEPAASPGFAPGLVSPGASVLDFKGLARLEKFDVSDVHWLDWKGGFQSFNGTAQPDAVRICSRSTSSLCSADAHEAAPHDLEELLGGTCEVHLQVGPASKRV